MHPTPNFAPDGMSGGFPSQDPERFTGIVRDYTPADVAKLSGTFRVRHTLAEMGATRLWHLLKTEPYVNTLGALTGNQAMQQVRAGLNAVCLECLPHEVAVQLDGPVTQRRPAELVRAA